MAWLLLLTGLSASRVAGAAEIYRVAIGFDGSYQVGRWTPIEVDLRNAEEDLSTCFVMVSDADGNATLAPLSLIWEGEAGLRRYSGIFRSGRLDAPVRVLAGTATRTIVPSSDGADGIVIRPARQSVRFLGVLGPGELIKQAAAAANGTTDGGESGAERVRAIEFLDWDALPASSDGWDALDVLFVSGDFSGSETQSEAVRNWVRRGGHLVLSIGDRGDAFQASNLAGWVPAEVGGSRRVIELATLVDRVPGAPQIPVAGGIVAAQLNAQQGQVLISSFEGPLVARFAFGIGRVTVSVLDFTTPPLSDWEGAAPFCLYLADVDVGLDAAAESAADSQLRSTGISDLATQLASNLDSFPTAANPSYGTVLAFVLCFLIIVGPVDYLLVHRLLKRPRLTWVTFPTAVLLAAGCGAVLARQTHPQQSLVNQFEVVDIDVAQATMHVRSWVTMYSPTPRRQSVEFTVDSWMTVGDEAATAKVSWFGKPEAGFRGMYRTGGSDQANPAYEFAPDYASIENLPIDQWSTKSLTADWESISNSVPARSSLEDDGTGKLTGTFSHDIAGEISDWILAYGNYVYFPRDSSGASHATIAPGVPFEPAEAVQVPRILRQYLVGLGFVLNAGDDVSRDDSNPSRESYDPLNRNPLDLIRAITFHEAAGGREYSGLTNHSLSRRDFSVLLPLNRAVLLGRVAGPATRLVVDGQEIEPADSSTFIRIILPVRPASR